MPNNNQQLIDALEAIRAQLGVMVATLDRAINDYVSGSDELCGADFDAPLRGNYGFFKGKKPVAVLFPDGRVVDANTWKKCVREILSDSANTPSVHETMLELRGRIAGRDRVLLSADPKGMDSPINFSDGLYFESKFDTESLLYALVDRVLKPCGYDASGIRIRVRL